MDKYHRHTVRMDMECAKKLKIIAAQTGLTQGDTVKAFLTLVDKGRITLNQIQDIGGKQ